MKPLSAHPLLALSTLPAGAYLLIERGILRGNTAIMGARLARLSYMGVEKSSTHLVYSVWVFVLLGAEAIKAFKANPYFA